MNTFSDYFYSYWNSWAIEFVIIVTAFVMVLLNWRKIARFTMSYTLMLAVIIWLGGVVVYSLGFAYEGSGGSLTAFFLRAAQASLGMFISENELIEVSNHYKESTPYMIAFTLIHISAIFLSTILVINTIGFRLRHRVLIRHLARKSALEDIPTHFFWGFTDETFTMAEDIRKTRPSDRIIYVRSTTESALGERMEVTQLIGSSSSFRQSLHLKRKIDSISDSVVLYVQDGKNWMSNNSIHKLISNTTRISFYTFTSDEKTNLKLGAEIFTDPELNAATGKKIRIHTLASRDGQNRVIQDFISIKMSEGCRIRWNLIDRPYLSVRALSLDSVHHPVTSIKDGMIRNGAVDGEFTAIIIGFGKMGQHMFKHLYEFSSFIGPDGKPTPKKFLIVDPDINQNAGPLCIYNPSFFKSEKIKLITAEPGSVKFWMELREYVNTVNCISIELDSDEKNMDMAMDIYRGLLQYSDMRPQNVKIFLQICSSDKDRIIKQLSQNYNQQKERTGIEIVTFGSCKDIFSCDVVMASDVHRNAKLFNYNFDQLRGINADCTPEEAWSRDFSIKRHIERYNSTTLALESYYILINQCIADYSHIGTLLTLAGIKPGDTEALRKFVEIIKRRDPRTRFYPGEDEQFQLMMENLAKCAHQRVITFNWLYGCRKITKAEFDANPSEAARKKLNPFMAPWAECDESMRLEAYAVVDTSFIIASRQGGC